MNVQALQAPGAPIEIGADEVAPSAPVAPLAPADSRDAARFSELIEGDAAVGETPAAAGASRAAAHSMGDNILSGLQNVSTDLKNSWQGIGDSLKGPLSATRILQVQMGLAGLVLQYELISKAVSRSEQNIDQLVKLQ